MINDKPKKKVLRPQSSVTHAPVHQSATTKLNKVLQVILQIICFCIILSIVHYFHFPTLGSIFFYYYF